MTDDVKKLYRTQEDRMIAGVCSGLAAYFKIDPIIIRVLFVVFAIIGGSSILIYLILWILIPDAPDGSPEIELIEETDEPEEEEEAE
jgi:phage shock protein C